MQETGNAAVVTQARVEPVLREIFISEWFLSVPQAVMFDTLSEARNLDSIILSLASGGGVRSNVEQSPADLASPVMSAEVTSAQAAGGGKVAVGTQR